VVTRLRARKRRPAERGATLLIVLMVLTLLVGIGAFTARSSQLAIASSGNVRQQTQARYVGEYGLMMVTALLGGSGGQSYLKQISQATDKCTGQEGMTMPSCAKITHTDIEKMFESAGGTPFHICEAAVPGAHAGSLGMADAECRFNIELTDKTQGSTPSGFDTAGGKPLVFFYVTATATAQVVPKDPANSNANTLTAMQLELASTQVLRSRVLAGPYPAN
jgi:hypothetical protein